MDEIENVIEVSDEPGSYFSDEIDIKTKNIIKTVTSHKIYLNYLHIQRGIHLNKVKPFNISLNTPKCVISENINSNSTVTHSLCDAQI